MKFWQLKSVWNRLFHTDRQKIIPILLLIDRLMLKQIPIPIFEIGICIIDVSDYRANPGTKLSMLKSIEFQK